MLSVCVCVCVCSGAEVPPGGGGEGGEALPFSRPAAVALQPRPASGRTQEPGQQTLSQ